MKPGAATAKLSDQKQSTCKATILGNDKSVAQRQMLGLVNHFI